MPRARSGLTKVLRSHWTSTSPAGLGLLVAAAIVLGPLSSPTGVAASASPTLSASPDTGPANATVSLAGTGMPKASHLQVEWDGSTQGMPVVKVGGTGTFNTTVDVPSASPVGSHTIAVVSLPKSGTAAASTIPLATTPYSVTSASPTPTPTAKPSVAPTATPTVAPTPTATASTGIPPMPAGDKLRKSFSDGSLAPFRAVTYPNAHPSDAMSYACNYATDSSVISVHDGYLDVRSNRRSDGRWNCGFLSTGMDGNGNAASFSFTTGYVQFAAQANVGYATWQDPLWLLNTVTGWHSAEVDAAEAIDGKLTFNIHGPANVGVVGKAPPADYATKWHVFGIAKASDHITFTMDGVAIGRWNGSMPDPMALLIDSKVGFQWESVYPNSSTPSPAFAHVAWVTVSSSIPAGL